MSTPKSRMEDRQSVTEESRQTHQQVNGTHHRQSGPNSSPRQPPKKRVRYSEPPIWARSAMSRPKKYGPIPTNSSKLNGRPPVPHNPTPISSSVPVKIESNGTKQHYQVNPQSNRQVDTPALELLGEWEPSILGNRPTDSMTKLLADWIYLKVVSRADIGELSSRGVEVEIEAKLGQLIDSDTNQRYYVPVQSECILSETGRVRFVSSMTEVSYLGLTLIESVD